MFKSLQKRAVTGIVLALVFVALLVLPAYSYSLIWGIVLLLTFAVFAAPLEFVRFSTDGYTQRAKASGYFLALFVPLVALFLYALYLLNSGRTDPILLSLADSISVFSPVEAALVVLSSLLTGFLLTSLYCFLVPSLSLDLVSRQLGELLLALMLFLLGGGALLFLPLLYGGTAALGWLVLVVASNDTAAYFIGQRFGKTKLSESISPGKTRIGSLGGLLVGTLIGGLFSWLLPDYLRVSPVLLVAFVVVLIAQLGDLSKSFLKRMHQVKDSGALLPGHGGVLDRIDGYLSSAPVLLLWLSFEYLFLAR